MKRFGILVFVVVALTGLVGHSIAQSGIIGFACIGDPSMHLCADGSTIGLRGYTGPVAGTPPPYVSVAGYYSPGDHGDGNYAIVGPASTSCESYSSGSRVTGNGSVGKSELKHLGGGGLSINQITVGELVNASGTDGSGNPIQTAPGTEIASIDTTNSNITLTLPLTGTATGTVSDIPVVITGDNTGTLIIDSESPQQCWRKTNYRGEPHEFGAYGDGSHDDTSPIEYWLGAGGPWDATVASNANSLTGSTIYQVSNTIYCWPGINIRAPAVDGTSGVAPVTIQAAPTGGTWMLPPPWPALSVDALMAMEGNCRISGLSIDANKVTSLNTVVIDSGVLRPIIDSHSTILNGFHNLYCPYPSGTGSGIEIGDGLRVSDSIFGGSHDNNIEIDHCDNTKISNSAVENSGKAGIVFSILADFNLSGSTIEQSTGPGLLITNTVPGTSVTGTPDLGSIVGNFFDSNGETGGAGIEFDGAAHFSVCGNHFNRNDNASSGNTAHIRFAGGANTNSISFCGNDYRVDAQTAGGPDVPGYVYDVTGAGTTVTNTNFYENPIPQKIGVFSPAAGTAALPQAQIAPAARNFLTGFVLTNDSMSAQTVDIAPGSATDSTGQSVIALTNPTGCNVNLGSTSNGLNALDTGSVSPDTTYFFFAVEDLAPMTIGENTPSCIASASLSPNLAAAHYGYGVYRLVGALYTDGSADVVKFQQSGDTFYLATSVTDIQTGTTYICATTISGPTSCPLSVPCGRMASCTGTGANFAVEAFGRIVGGSNSHPLLVSSPLQPAQTPMAFPAAPGYSSTNAVVVNGTAAFPFELYTDGQGEVRVNEPSLGSGAASAYEVTDGWVWRR